MRLSPILLAVTVTAFAQPPMFEIYPFAGVPLDSQLVHEGPADRIRIWDPQSIFVSAAGDIYVSDSFPSAIFRVDSAGQLKFDSFTRGRRFIIGRDGAPYVLSPRNDSILRMDRATNTSTVWAGTNKLSRADGTPIQDADIGPNDLALGPDGLIYFIDGLSNRVRRVSGDGRLETIAGSGTGGVPQPGAPAALQPLEYPADISLDTQGRVYFRTAGIVGKIYRVDALRRLELLVDPVELYKLEPFRRPPGSFSGVELVKAAPNGGVYFFDRGLQRIILRTPTGSFLSIAGGGSQSFRDGRLASDVRIGRVEHMQVDPQNRLIIAFSDLKQFYRIESDGRLKLLAGIGGGDGDGGPAEKATLFYPRELSLDANGSVYVHDLMANRIRAIDTSGSIRTVAGTGLQIYTDPCLPGLAVDSDIAPISGMTTDPRGALWTTHSYETAVCLSDPSGVRRRVVSDAALQWQNGGTPLSLGARAVDKQGNLIATDGSPPRIWRVTPQGLATPIAGRADRSGFSSDGVPAMEGSLEGMREVAIGPEGFVYFVQGRNTIRYIDGSGSLRSLNSPIGVGNPRNGERFASAAVPDISQIAWDPNGLLYFVGDRTRIYRVERDGTVWHIAGLAPGEQKFAATGPATGVGMAVEDIVIDANGVLYASDLSYRRIFRMYPGGAQRLSAIDGNGQTAPAGRSLGKPLRVSIFGPSSTPIAGKTVRFEVLSGDARLSHAERVTDALGQAWAYITMGTTSGPVTVRASAESVGSVEFSLTATAPIFSPRPVLFEESMVGAGFSDPPVKRFSPNGLVTVFGEDLAPAGLVRAVGLEDLNGLRLPTVLADTCVEVNGLRAPMMLVTPSQINFVFPSAGTSGTARVRMLRNCTAGVPLATNELTVELAELSPEFLTFGRTADNKPLVAAMSAVTGELIGPRGAIPGVVTRPARYREPLMLFAVGLGATQPATVPGEIRLDAATITKTLYVFAPDFSVGSVLYAGVAPGFAGLYQVNLDGHNGHSVQGEQLTEIYFFYAPNVRSASVYLAVSPNP